MSPRKTSFEVENFYHCYSRGIDKCLTFFDDSDYLYLLESMYLSNRKARIPDSKRRNLSHKEIWELPDDQPLVAIVAYCLMPNHFHFLFKEIEQNGISTFMQRLMTSYTMHFNIKHKRRGGLFTRPFRSKHVGDDCYLQEVFKYIHLNPSELIAENMKDGRATLKPEESVIDYEFSSLPDYIGQTRSQRVLLTKALPW